ncbi:MAG: hypothetical protein K2X45_19945 [Phreatobacter sp.]|jgi:hypothetical protein|nr:hypothetical protein [Phreatobacter sp.]
MAALFIGTLALLLMGTMSVVAGMWMSPEGMRLREATHVLETSMASQREELQAYLASMRGRWPTSTELMSHMAVNAQRGRSRVAMAPDGHQWMISGSAQAITFCLLPKSHPVNAAAGTPEWTDADGARINRMAKRLKVTRANESVELAAACTGAAAACPGPDPFCTETTPRVLRHVLARP